MPKPNEPPAESRDPLTEALREIPPPNHSPEVRARLEEFHKGIAAEMAASINSEVLDEEKTDPE